MTTVLDNLDDALKQTILLIPYNQRGYAWTDKEIDALLRDIERSDSKGAHHYFGAIVVSTIPDKEHKFKQYFWKFKYLEDGQQRVTTLLLICSELEKRLRSAANRSPSGDAELINLSRIVRTHGDDSSPQQLILQSQTAHDNELLCSLFNQSKGSRNANTPAAQRLVKAHAHIAKWVSCLETTSDVEGWATRIREAGRFFIVDLQQEKIDRNLAFNCINSRGLPLSEFDRVKNYCMMVRDRRISTGESVTSEALKNLDIPGLWFEAVATLDRFGLESRRNEGDFLLEMYRSWSGETASLGEVSAKLESEFDSLLRGDNLSQEQRLVSFVKLWPVFAEAFAVVTADRACKEIAALYKDHLRSSDGQWLDRFHDLDYVGIVRAILSASWIRFSKEEFIEIARACEKYVFRVHAVMRRRTDFQGPARCKLAKAILDCSKSKDEVVQDLYQLTVGSSSEPIAPLERVVHEIGNRQPKYRYWDHLYYFLFEYEMDLQGGLSTRSYPKGKADLESQIEHVLPQSYSSISEWTAVWSDERVAREAMHRIGNLVHTKNNSRLGNKEFAKKIILYGKRVSTLGEQEIAIDKYLSDGQVWDLKSINARENLLMAFAFKRWRFSCSDPSVCLLPHGETWKNGSNEISEATLDR